MNDHSLGGYQKVQVHLPQITVRITKRCPSSTTNFRRQGKGSTVEKGQDNWSEIKAGWLPSGATTASCLPRNVYKHLTLITSRATPWGRYYDHPSWRNWGTQNISNLLEVTQLEQWAELGFGQSAPNHKLCTGGSVLGSRLPITKPTVRIHPRETKKKALNTNNTQ